MPLEYTQSAKWPGVVSVASCQYVCSHGITPGKAILTTYPQGDAPRQFGDLLFSDGRGQVKIPNCKVDSITPQVGPNGTTFTLEILDARWQWAFGAISGQYNLTDNRGKLVPWTIRSPKELAELCLKAMSVRSYTIQLPTGLDSSAGRDLQRYLKLGDNFPQSFTNPETIWEHIPPAEALAQLADLYGCRIIFQPNRAHVLVGPIGGAGMGIGYKPFPPFPFESIGLTIDGPEAPAYVGVYGAPVKYQAKFALEAVAEEWDGSYVPVNEVSYAPEVVAPVNAKYEVRAVDDGTGKTAFVVVYGFEAAQPIAVAEVPNAGTLTGRFEAAALKLNTNPGFSKVATASVVGGQFFIEGKGGAFFTVEIFENAGMPGSDWLTANVSQAGASKEKPWRATYPPLFLEVSATTRLSYSEAKLKAQKSVYRCYRIRNVEVSERNRKDPGPLVIPAYGPVKRRQQVVLQNSKVEQVVPQPRIDGAADKGALADPKEQLGALPEFYNGYSRDRENTVTGSVHAKIGNVNWYFVLNGEDQLQERYNTSGSDRVFVSFDVNQVEQMIVFAEPVYKFVNGFYDPADLILEAGCFVLDAVTSAPKRWEEILRVPGGTAPAEWHHREDVQVGVIGEYGSGGGDRLTGFRYADLTDARSRAGYYLRGLAARYKIVGGETRQYIGIIPHDPDGFCQQTTWIVGDAGATTIVSGNTEHNVAIPSYPARRRAENLSPNNAAAAANLRERVLMKTVKPQEVKLETGP